LGPDEMRVVALGTGMPTVRPEQATVVTPGTDPATRAARSCEATGWHFRPLDTDGEAIYEEALPRRTAA